MTFSPTPEQAAIIAAARDTSDNLLIDALAGAAKTSTLVMIAEALPDTQILCLAFNKKIAVEMASRLPPNCTAMTLNSLGHRVWSEATGRRLRLETGKTYKIVKSLIDDLAPDDKKAAYDSMAEIMKLVDFGKQCGYIPSGSYEGKAKRLFEDDFFEHIENKLSKLEEDLIRQATLISIKQAFEGIIDFGDQILMPTVFHGAFPRYPLVLIDESQDLSALNHATLGKLVKKRIIAVGDPCQAIYGFRGAHEDSMQLLKKRFEMTELRLSVSFRCPVEIVKHSHWRAPHMKYPDWAKPGKISYPESWTAADLPESAVIICRNNAPLFSTAIRLLKNGRSAELSGNDVAKTLAKTMRKFGGSDLPQSAVLDRIAAWETAQMKKTRSRGHGSIRDQAECMRIFASQGQTLGDALAYMEHITQLHSPLKLLTGHKSKGLEFDDVFFLDEFLIKKEDQEPNLRYVIQTRTKNTLTYIRSEDFRDA